MKNDLLDLINNRCSVRNFTGETVTKNELITLVKAGMAAPSARNIQPWNFIIITNRKVLDSLCEKLPFSKMLAKAGAAIVVCGTPRSQETPTLDFWVEDCCAATQNILLAAHSLGLGAVWTAAYPDKDRIATVKEVLGISDPIIPLNVIPIGHPTGTDKPKNKFKEENIYWEKWSEEKSS